MAATNNNRWFWFAGVLFYFLALLMTVPAAMMEWLAPRLSGNLLQLQGTHGGFWQGEAANLLLKSSNSEYKPLGAIKWRVAWWTVLHGEVAVTLELMGTGKVSHGTVAWSFTGLRLRDVDAAMPLATMVELFPEWRLWQPGGMLELRTEKLTFVSGGVEGAGELRCLGTSSSLSHLNPFGSYQVMLKDGRLDLRTLQGPLQLSGNGEWDKRGLRFNGLATADPSNRAKLQDFMRLLGQEDGRGGYRMVFAAVRHE